MQITEYQQKSQKAYPVLEVSLLGNIVINNQLHFTLVREQQLHVGCYFLRALSGVNCQVPMVLIQDWGSMTLCSMMQS